MNDKPGIALYCLCWNEARIIPFFLRHYLPLVERIFVFDNGSTDQSLTLLSGDERIKVAHFRVPADSFVDEERRLSDAIWKPSRGEADWVAVVDMDEHIHHSDLHSHLAACRRQGITAIQAVGYEMVSVEFPEPDATLCDTITTGFRYPAALDKFCLFDPNAIAMSNFHPGRHKASPVGRVVWDTSESVKLLHYKQLSLDYFIKRTGELCNGLRPDDFKNGWGEHYKRTPQQLTRDFLFHHSLARPVPGLDFSGNEAPEVHLIVSGARIDPISVEGTRFRFALPSGSTAVRIVSRCASPFMPPLGVSVEELILWRDDERCEIPLDSPALRDGWWGATRAGDGGSRWTNGNALLLMPPLMPDANQLEVRLSSAGFA
jgi:Glycosyl transferase family 2